MHNNALDQKQSKKNKQQTDQENIESQETEVATPDYLVTRMMAGDPNLSNPKNMMGLQKTFGNTGVQRMLVNGNIQRSTALVQAQLDNEQEEEVEQEEIALKREGEVAAGADAPPAAGGAGGGDVPPSDNPDENPAAGMGDTHFIQRTPAADAEILMPEPPEGMLPEEQARVDQVKERATQKAEAEKTMPPAEENVTEARGAVAEPKEETDARAENKLVAEVSNEPQPSPEIEEMCTRIRQAIRDRRPPDEDSLLNTDPEEAAKAAGQELNSSVQTEADRVEGEYDDMDQDPQGTAEKQAQPMGEIPEAESTPEVDAQAAAPNQTPAEEVSLDADVQAQQAKMDEAGMETEPAKLVESGPIAEAREAQGELEEKAAVAPEEVLAEQREAIDAAKTDMAALQAQAMAALETSRANTKTGVRTGQTDMVGSEEEMRQQISLQATTIFTNAQQQVNDLLTPLPTMAMALWDTGIVEHSTQFDNRLNRVKEWIEERHSGGLGGLVQIWDNVFGYPDWIIDEYNAAETEFGDNVCNLLRDISTQVNGVVASCHAIIQQARDDITQLFSNMPAELQDWAQGELANFNAQLDGLSTQVNTTRDDFNQQLTQRAATTVQEARQRVHDLRQEAGGIIGRIAAAVEAFLADPARFIINGLLELVGISPGAFWALVDQLASVIDAIAEDPMAFANNLVNALKAGFGQFFDNIGTHLLDGLLQWLFSGLGAVGVTAPKDFSLPSVITFFMQVMGISWERIRTLLAKHVGEENVALIEQAWSVISELIAKGPEGIFEMIQEQLDPQAIFDMVLDAAISYVTETLIKQVSLRILGMLNPAGAIVQAIEVIYKVLDWVINNAAQIFELVQTVVQGAADLVAGNISGMANAIEGALARTLPIVIDFLAGLVGLGDLPQKVADIIKGIQSQVEAILERVIAWMAERGKELLAALRGKEENPDGEQSDDEEDGDVKVKVEQELGQRLGNTFSGYEELKSIVDDVYAKYQPEGLKSLDVVESDTVGVFNIYAEASPKKKVSAEIKPILGITISDLDLSRPSTAATGTLRVGTQSHDFGKTFRSGGGLHAEEKLIEHAEAAWDGLAVKGEKHVLAVNVTRSPCGEGPGDHNCSGQLETFVAKKRGEGWDVSLETNIMSLYGGTKNQASAIALEKLQKSGAELNVWNVIEILKDEGFDVEEISDPDMDKLAERIAQIQKELDRIKGI